MACADQPDCRHTGLHDPNVPQPFVEAESALSVSQLADANLIRNRRWLAAHDPLPSLPLLASCALSADNAANGLSDGVVVLFAG
ncbi:MAG: hypothetical protein HC841_08225, partial [Verrucomicrobiae bacterium]|nr:hypothetical protein [Verrucomicrobiae bacterium]